MKEITRASDIPDVFFLENLAVYRGVVQRQEMIQRPENLDEINGKIICVPKKGGNLGSAKGYEKFLVRLDDVPETPLSDISPPSSDTLLKKDAIDNKRRRILDQSDYAFHYLNRKRIIDLFDKLKYECKTSKVTSELCEKIVQLDKDDDPGCVNRFILYLHSLWERNLSEDNRVILDLEFTQSKSKGLITFDAHIEAIRNEGYVFDESELNTIRSRLKLKDEKGILGSEGIVGYIRTLANRPVIISASFKVEILNRQLDDDESGHYNLYFRHEDSDLVDLDIVVSTLVPRKDIASELKPIYDFSRMQPFDAIIVGSMINRPDLLTNRGCDLYIAPIAVYS